jgi:hypothetical protein
MRMDRWRSRMTGWVVPVSSKKQHARDGAERHGDES